MLNNCDINLWTVDAPFSITGVQIGVRMTIVREGSDLWIHSPIAIDDVLAREIEALGRVRWIVAPNLMHHLFVRAAVARWPDATLFAPGGFEHLQAGLTFTALGTESDGPESLYAFKVDGLPKIEETVFLHPSSASLIVVDFAFHIPKSAGVFTRMMFNLVNGGTGKTIQTKMFRKYIKDHDAYTKSVAPIRDVEFDRLILSHGLVQETAGKNELLGALEWMN